MPATAFRPANELMCQFAEFHRDRRNIVTHFVGIPLVIWSIGILLSKPAIGGVSLAWIAWILATGWYLTRGNLVLGIATSFVNALLVSLGQPFAPLAMGHWLGWSLSVFVVGWCIQFLGHYYEGRRATLVDDLVGLLVGPMFVVGEWLFAIGWGQALHDEIERRVGPTHLRDLAASPGR
ncbi:MAG: Mpo1-like protein [Burkholderiaceae bacterium]